MDTSAKQKELVINANYELFVAGLVVLTLVNWVILAWVRSTPESAQVVWIVNTGLCAFLLLDFAFRLWRHPHRWTWLGPIGLFSALTSFLAHSFLRPRSMNNQPQTSDAAEIQNLDRLSVLLRTYDVQLLLADTQRPPVEVLAELRRKVQEINTRGE